MASRSARGDRYLMQTANCLKEFETMTKTRTSLATAWIHQEHWLALRVDGVEEERVEEPTPVPRLDSGRLVVVAWI